MRRSSSAQRAARLRQVHLVQLLRTLLRAAAANDDDGRQGSLVVAHVGSDDLYMTQEQRRVAGIPSRWTRADRQLAC